MRTRTSPVASEPSGPRPSTARAGAQRAAQGRLQRPAVEVKRTGATTRAALAADAHAGFAARGGSRKTVEGRAALARLLWNARGERKLPAGRALDRALTALPPDELAWLCELAPLGPLYALPTRPFVGALAKTIAALGVSRVLEVAAGDGFLARSLAQVAPSLQVVASDSGAWVDPRARMTEREQRALAKVQVPGLTLGRDVVRLSAARAIARFEPELVLCSWLPPGHRLLDALIRAPVRYVLELGAGSGVTASAWSWRFAHEFLDGPIEQTARCRLDSRPQQTLHSRVTLYYGAAHPEHYLDKVRPGDWLDQFRPRP